mgnify:CR=1 FL=1
MNNKQYQFSMTLTEFDLILDALEAYPEFVMNNKNEEDATLVENIGRFVTMTTLHDRFDDLRLKKELDADECFNRQKRLFDIRQAFCGLGKDILP